MTYHIEYELDEFRPWPALSVYVYGTATISYKWEAPDRDTGYRGGPCDIELQHLTIYGHRNGDPAHAIEQTDPLFLAIESTLQNSDGVIQACIDDHEEI